MAIEIVDFPIKMVIFHSYVNVYQRVIVVDNGYPLVIFNSLSWYRWPIEIDGLQNLKMVIFHGYVK